MGEENASNSNLTRDPKEIVVYHVGGEGGYGPITSILMRMKAHARLVVFEARTNDTIEESIEHLERDGIPVSIVRIGIDEVRGNAEFYVNKFPMSSSLLPGSPLAAEEDPVYPFCFVWGENVELDHIVRVDTVSLDELISEGKIPPPDVLSIDAQGAELRILRGAVKALASDVFSVVSEVEFHEIYRGQGLFDGQMQLLGQNGFRLLNLLNQQFWHPGPRCGVGFLTVAEAVFLKCVKDIPEDDRGCISAANISDDRLVRLAAVAMCFGALSYSAQLMNILRRRSPAHYDGLRKETHYGELVKLTDMVNDNMEKYRADKDFFSNNILFEKRHVADEAIIAETGFSLKGSSVPEPERKAGGISGFFRKVFG